MEIRGFYDLSVPLETYMPIWPTNPQVEVRPLGTVPKDGYKVETYFSATHSGTHIDTPSHMLEDGMTLEQVPISSLIGEGYVIRPDLNGTEITLSSIKKIWKREYDGNIVLIHTGWDRKRAYTKEFQYDFPGLGYDTIEFLSEHKPKMIGIDTLGIEPFNHSDFRVHKALLSLGMIFIEDLAGLGQLEEEKKYLVAAMPVKIKGASGGMARVVALDIY